MSRAASWHLLHLASHLLFLFARAATRRDATSPPQRGGGADDAPRGASFAPQLVGKFARAFIMSAKLLKSITQANKWFNTIMKSTTSSSREVAAPRRGALAEAVAPLVRRGVARSARRRGKIRMPPRGAEPALPGWDHVAVKLARPAGPRSRRRDVAEEEKGSVDAARLSVPQQRVGAAVSPRGSRIKSLPYLRCVAAGAARRAKRASLGRSRHRQPPPLDARRVEGLHKPPHARAPQY